MRPRFALWLLRRWAPSAYGQIKACRHEQSKRSQLLLQHTRLLAAHERERSLHRAKVAECEQLKTLTDPEIPRVWKASRLLAREVLHTCGARHAGPCGPGCEPDAEPQ